MADASPRRPGLWVEIALALALITLATILLNAGVYWLLIKTTEAGRRTDLAEAMSGAVIAQLETSVEGRRLDPDTTRRVLAAYSSRGLEITELWVVDPSSKAIAALRGQPPQTLDPGLREALYGRSAHIQVSGSLLEQRSVAVTAPVMPAGGVVGALRLRLPLKGTPVPGGPAAFVLGYTAFSGVAIALFGFVLFRRRLIGPIRKLQAGTDRIAEGEFGHTLDIDAAAELLDLTVALNTMSASLQGYRERTAEQVERLEQANTELRAAQEALVRSERLASVGRLAAGLAHEVGNPLSAVLGYIELLQQDREDPAFVGDLIDRCERELVRIHRIIQQLLGHARGGATRVEVVQSGAAITDAVDAVQHQARFAGIALSVCVDDDLPSVRIDPAQLHQVLVNLLLNSAEALAARGEAGADAPEVRVQVRHDAGEVWMEVLDNGHGFSEVSLDRAFEPFFTTRDVGEGTGLGLSTSLEIIRSAGGRMEAGNRPGGGAWVALALPIAVSIEGASDA